MCTVCGCGAGEVKLEGAAHDHGHEHPHVHADGTVHSHAHDHASAHAHSHDAPLIGAHEHAHHQHGVGGDLDYGTGPARAHVPGMSQSRMVQIEQDILAKNNSYADANRRWFDERGIFALNLVSSPGSGKTTLLVTTIERSRAKWRSACRGDPNSNDAERIRRPASPRADQYGKAATSMATWSAMRCNA